MQISGHRMLQDCCGRVCRQPASGIMLAAHLRNMCSTFCIRSEFVKPVSGNADMKLGVRSDMFLEMMRTCEE